MNFDPKFDFGLFFFLVKLDYILQNIEKFLSDSHITNIN